MHEQIKVKRKKIMKKKLGKSGNATNYFYIKDN